MRFHYKGFCIDPTPDRAAEMYVAHVRVAMDEATTGVGANEPIDRAELGRFPREALAYEHAVNWAIAWIDARKIGASDS